MTRLIEAYDTDKTGDVYATEIPSLHSSAYDLSPNANEEQIVESSGKLYKEDIISYASSELQLKGTPDQIKNSDPSETDEEDDQQKPDDINGSDWNARLHLFLDETEDSPQKFTNLRNLYMDFVAIASSYGKTIIMEMNLPPSQKTIKPFAIGGFAGGEKYLCNGILFKFALDQPMGNGFLYGGLFADHGLAMKGAACELLALNTFYHAVSGIKTKTASENNNSKIDFVPIRCPLVCCIDYRGFRLLASSLVPVNSTTLVYGSNDSGRTIHRDDTQVNNTIQYLGKLFNLKDHLAGTDGVRMTTAGDVEIHLGLDANYYALDLARLWPPEGKNYKSLRLIVKAPRALLYKDGSRARIYSDLLRPEFVMTWLKPLCCDAFSGWQRSDPNTIEHNQEVAEATLNLHQVVIPNTASKFAESFPNLMEQPDFSISKYLHNHGINLRHLARFRSNIQSTSQNAKCRSWLLTEMVARTIKSEISIQLRKKVAERSESNLNQVYIDYFNNLLGGSVESTLFWLKEVKTALYRKYYDQGLSLDESDEFHSLQSGVDMYLLFQRLEELLSVKISDRVMNAVKSKQARTMTFPDLVAVQPGVKYQTIAVEFTAMYYFHAAESLHDTNPADALSLLEQSKSLFQTILNMSRSVKLQYYVGRTEHLHWEISRNNNFLKKSIEALRTGVELGGESFPQIHVALANALADSGDLPKAYETYLHAFKSDKSLIDSVLEKVEDFVYSSIHGSSHSVSHIRTGRLQRSLVVSEVLYHLYPKRADVQKLGVACSVLILYQFAMIWEPLQKYTAWKQAQKNTSSDETPEALFTKDLASRISEVLESNPHIIEELLSQSAKQLGLPLSLWYLMATHCPGLVAKLQQLNLGKISYAAIHMGNLKLLDTSLAAVVESTLHLKSAIFSGSYPAQKVLAREIVQRGRQLKSISLENVAADAMEDYIKLVQSQANQLEEISLMEIYSFPNAFWVIGLGQAKNLTKLILSKCTMGGDILMQLLKNNPSLTYLNLSSLYTAQDDKLLEDTKVAACIGTNCTKLKTLILESHFTAAFVETLTKASGSPVLEELHLHNGSSFTDAAVAAVASTYKELKYLDLNEAHQITDEALDSLSKGCQKLEKLVIKYAGKIVNPFKSLIQLPALKSLTMQQTNSVSEDSFKEFEHFPALREFSIDNVRGFNQNSIPFIVDYGNLTSLQCGSNYLNDSISQVIYRSWTNLTKLDLSNTKIKDLTLKYIGEVAPQLKHLAVTQTDITSKGVQWMTQGIRQLEFLDVSYCIYLTDFAISQLIQFNPNLKYLTLQNVPIINYLIFTEAKNLVILNIPSCLQNDFAIRKLRLLLPNVYIGTSLQLSESSITSFQ